MAKKKVIKKTTIGIIFLSIGIVFHEVRHIKVKTKMSRLPWSWRIFLILTSFVYLFFIFSLFSVFLSITISDEVFLEAEVEKSGIRDFLGDLWLFLFLLSPKIWAYFRFDNRDPKWAGFIEDSEHEFEEPWFLNSSEQTDRRVLDTRTDSGNFFFWVALSFLIGFFTLV